MPLTVRQFDLGIDQEMDAWMRQVYELLIRNQHLAYSSEELSKEVLGASAEKDDREKFVLALDVLFQIQAVEKRWVNDTGYYAFSQAFNTNTWERDLKSHPV